MNPMEGASAAERVLLRQASIGLTPINGSIELLPLCNMNCDMCYVRLSREEMERQGRLRTAEEWLSVARQMKEAGTLFLLLTGGEPLIYPDFRRLYLELRNLGMLVTINTNATLIDEEWAAFFGEHRPRRINITLYGADERAYRELCHYPGGFERTLRGIRLLRERNVEVRISFCVTRENAENLERVIAITKELNVPILVDPYMVPAERERNRPFDQQSRLTPEQAAQAYCKAMELILSRQEYLMGSAKLLWEMVHQQIDRQKSSCPAGRASFSVNWQGQLHPCVMQVSPAADVFHVGFAEAWRQVVQGMKSIHLSNQCRDCRLRLICRTCSAAALYETGSYGAVPDYMCRYTKERIWLMTKALQDMQKDRIG